MAVTKKHFKFVITVIVLVVLWIAFCFSRGYKIPQKDKHTDWPYFPQSTNANIKITPLPVFLYSISPIAGSNYYMVFYTPDSARFADLSSDQENDFGIISNKGKFIARYSNEFRPYYDNSTVLIIYPKKDTCDIFDMRSNMQRQALLGAIVMPTKTDHNYYITYPKAGFKPISVPESYLKSLKGVRAVEDRPVDESPGRGYGLFKNDSGDYYVIKNDDDIDRFTKLCIQCQGYQATDPGFLGAYKGPDIKQSDSATVFKNNLESGFYTSWGIPTGGHGSGYKFQYYQSYLLYYSAHVGDATTSFKIKNGTQYNMDINFQQLKPLDNDTITFIFEKRLWQMYREDKKP